MEHGQMRRSRQELDAERCIEMLERGTSGVLALVDENGFPYAVPLSYVFDSPSSDEAGCGRLIFHSAKKGYKLDAIAHDNRASFCVIDQDLIVPEEFTTYFRSVIAFGRMRLLEDDAEKRTAIELLSRKYCPDASPAEEAKEITSSWKSLCMMEMSIDRMSGKEAIELVRARGVDADSQ